MTARTCVDCVRPIRPPGCPRTAQTRQAGARGLCASCYKRHTRLGTLADYERTRRSTQETLEDWWRLRAAGLSRPDIAARLGIKEQSLYTALWRARRRGLEVSA